MFGASKNRYIFNGHPVKLMTRFLTVLPNVADERICGGLEILDNVLVQRIHVLHEPLGGAVVDLAGVVEDGEVRVALEVGLDELGVNGVGGGQLLHKGLVSGLGEPAFFVAKGHNAHWLKRKILLILKLQARRTISELNKVLKQVLNQNISFSFQQERKICIFRLEMVLLFDLLGKRLYLYKNKCSPKQPLTY